MKSWSFCVSIHDTFIPLCQVEVESDAANLIGHGSSSDAEDIDIEKYNQGTKSGAVKKPTS